MDSFAELWEMVKEECKKQVSESIYNVWFKDMELVSFDDNRVVIALSDFKRKIVESRFMNKLSESFKNVIGFDIDIMLVDVDKSAAVKSEDEDSDLKYTECTFDSFIVGTSNKFAYAAASAVANDPGGKYNPLFIYGNSGLGKTHLLNAIAHSISETNPGANIIYTQGESFTNELVKYIGQKSTEAFHEKYRNADVLLVDDVQFIAGRDSTQEEFFHTFNALYQAGNQIVLTSDRPPKEIATLEDRLRNRFEWGLIADISSPDLETRMAIIKRKAELLNFELPDDIVSYIAERLKNNIRQLEGAVKKMQAFVTMQNMPINIMTAQSVIKDIIVDNSSVPTVDMIVTEVARTYGADKEDIYSKKQNAQTTEMRQMAMYIVREMTELSTKLIGREFNRDHSTVVYSLDKFSKRYNEDSKLRSVVDNIMKNIRDGR